LRYESTTGLSQELIRELVARIAQVLPPRRGRPPLPGVYRSVLLTLIALRTNMPQTVLADLFGISQPTVSRVLRRFLPLIGQVLCPHTPPVPEVLRGRLALVDRTLVPTGNRAGQRGNYSGRRRRQGLSIQVLSDTDGALLAVSTPCRGGIHDRTALAETGWETLLEGTPTPGDHAYRGTTVIVPTRRAHGGGEHSPTDRNANREHSALRGVADAPLTPELTLGEPPVMGLQETARCCSTCWSE